MTDRDARRDQEVSEALDEERLPENYPPESPLGMTRKGVTPYEAEAGESLDERIQEDRSAGTDAAQPRPEPVPHLTEPDPAGQLLASEESGLAEHDIASGDAGAGDPTLRDAGQERESGPPAEEVAVHVEEER